MSLRRVSLLLVPLSLAWPRLADACSLCAPSGQAAPPDGATVPTDVPALWVYSPMAANLPARIQLTDEGGAAHPFHLGAVDSQPDIHLVVLDQPLVAGRRYLLTHPQLKERCVSNESVDVINRFLATPAAARPSAAGTLTVSATSRGPIDVWTPSGSCFATIGAAIADLRFTPSEKAAPYLPLSEVTLKVDGTPWATARAGEVSASGVPVAAEFAWNPRLDRLYAHCPTVPVDAFSDPNASHGLAAGPHHVELSLHLIGTDAAADPAPASVEVTLACADQPLPDPEAGCSCRVAPSRGAGAPGAAPLFGVAVAIALALRARRRPSRRER